MSEVSLDFFNNFTHEEFAVAYILLSLSNVKKVDPPKKRVKVQYVRRSNRLSRRRREKNANRNSQ